MSEGNVFGQPNKSGDDRLLDDLGATQPDWADDKAAQAHAEWVRDEELDDADPKIGGVEKTQFSDEKRSFRVSVQDLADERERLISERSYLISMGVDPDELEPIDGAAATLALHEAHPLLRVTPIKLDPPPSPFPSEFNVPMATSVPEAEKLAKDLLAKTIIKPKDWKDPRFPVTDEEITSEAARPVTDNELKRAYQWDGALGSKDSNPKEAFGSRKAGLSTISRQVLYEVGLAMLEGALKYGRHNYRIAGVRASTYYDACGRHMDAWWEGQDIDPDSTAKLHHVTKAIAGLTVIRDSMLAGNWTDDRPPSIGDPNWLAWYNEQAEILVDACKNPKPPFVKGDNE